MRSPEGVGIFDQRFHKRKGRPVRQFRNAQRRRVGPGIALKRVTRRDRGQSIGRAEFQLGIGFAHGGGEIHDLLRLGVLPFLQIGVSHVIERVQFLCFGGVAMPHGGVSARRVSGGAICRDGLFPHAKPREDVRWHVQGMRNPRCDGTVTPGGGQPALSQCRVVVAVDQIVSDAGMVRVFLPQLFQESSGLKLIG